MSQPTAQTPADIDEAAREARIQEAFEKSLDWAREQRCPCEHWSEQDKQALRRRIAEAMASCPSRSGASETARQANDQK